MASDSTPRYGYNFDTDDENGQFDDRDQDPRNRVERQDRFDRRRPVPRENRDHKAFSVEIGRVNMSLDVDLCLALSEFILQNGCDNPAIMAFAHQLGKAR